MESEVADRPLSLSGRMLWLRRDPGFTSISNPQVHLLGDNYLVLTRNRLLDADQTITKLFIKRRDIVLEASILFSDSPPSVSPTGRAAQIEKKRSKVFCVMGRPDDSLEKRRLHTERELSNRSRRRVTQKDLLMLFITMAVASDCCCS